jgi:hypothetical protein
LRIFEKGQEKLGGVDVRNAALNKSAEVVREIRIVVRVGPHRRYVCAGNSARCVGRQLELAAELALRTAQTK